MRRSIEDFERRGDYIIPGDILEEAQREFEKRSPRSRAMDRALRGSITTDYDKWKRLGGRGVDFPGVDTPSRDPSVGLTDHLSPRERIRVGQGRTKPVPESEVRLVERPTRRGHRPSVIETIEAAGRETWDLSGRIANVFEPGSAPYK